MRATILGILFVLGAVIAQVDTARAQLPVCQQPSSATPYHAACAPSFRLVLARFLFDLSIDHSLRGDRDIILREPGRLFLALNEQAREENIALRTYIQNLEALAFIRFDTATGMLQMKLPETARRFSGDIRVGGSSYPVVLQMPERLDAPYWRTPSVLQIALPERQRVSVRMEPPGGTALDLEVSCLVMSTDGVRIVTSGDAPDVLVRVDDCSP
jgi:hypothetical protein